MKDNQVKGKSLKSTQIEQKLEDKIDSTNEKVIVENNRKANDVVLIEIVHAFKEIIIEFIHAKYK